MFHQTWQTRPALNTQSLALILSLHNINDFYLPLTHSGGTGRFYVDPTSQTITTLVLNHIDEESLGMYTCHAGPLTTTYNVTYGKLETLGVGMRFHAGPLSAPYNVTI